MPVTLPSITENRTISTGTNLEAKDQTSWPAYPRPKGGLEAK
jgi:hypothetical protein